MSARRASTVCLLLFLLAAAGLVSSPLRPRAGESEGSFPTAGYRITGVVRDKISNFPLARFTVEVFDKDLATGPPLGVGVTDAEGRFQIDLAQASPPDAFLKPGRPRTFSYTPLTETAASLKLPSTTSS